jgi:uncharacterized protein YrrD
MLWNASAINGFNLSASDGNIGAISDFLFDDENWHVRWLVVNTGHWLAGRQVLLPSSAVKQIDQKNDGFSTKLTMQQIKDSPDVSTQRPVSRQMEASVYGHYGYLGGYGYSDDLNGKMAAPSDWETELETADAMRENDDDHLRSVNELTGYHIDANDGQIGHVADFLIEVSNWTIRYIVADTKDWWPGKKVLISPRSIRGLDWSVHGVKVSTNRQTIKSAPAYDQSMVIGQDYENKFLTHFKNDLADA